MADADKQAPAQPSRLSERVRQVGRGVEGALGVAAERVGTVKERVSGGPKLVNLKGTSGHDLLLDTDGRRSADPETLFTTDRETHGKVRKVTEGITSSLQVLANEPSLGLYRMEEHVLKAVPELVETKQKVVKLTAMIQGACHDVEYALNTVQQMHKISSFESLQAHTQRAIEFQQAIASAYLASLPPRKPVDAGAAVRDTPELVEPKGVFSTSLRTGETPENKGDQVPIDPPQGEAGEAGGDGAASAGEPPEAGATSDAPADGQPALKKKKKKKKAKEIVTKSF